MHAHATGLHSNYAAAAGIMHTRSENATTTDATATTIPHFCTLATAASPGLATIENMDRPRLEKKPRLMNAMSALYSRVAAAAPPPCSPTAAGLLLVGGEDGEQRE